VETSVLLITFARCSLPAHAVYMPYGSSRPITFFLKPFTLLLRLPPYHDSFLVRQCTCQGIRPKKFLKLLCFRSFECLLARLIRLNYTYLPSENPTYQDLVCKADFELPESVILDSSHHVLPPIFPHILSRSPGLRNRFHPFNLPLKDTKNFIPRVLYSSFVPISAKATPCNLPTRIRCGLTLFRIIGAPYINFS